VQRKRLYIILIIISLIFFMSSAVTCSRCSRDFKIIPKQVLEEEEEVQDEEEEAEE